MPAETLTTSRQTLTPECIVRAVKNLPSAPRVLPRLKLLLRDGNSSLRQVVQLVRLDAALAAKVLQIANSACFFTGARCVTVEEAVSRIGYDEVYGLVSCAVAVHVLNRRVAAYRMEADEMWAHSVCCGLAAEAIAERVGVDHAAAYTLGLLHGVGMIAIDEWAITERRELRIAMTPFPLEATRSERAVFGFTHAAVGGALLDAWEFPPEITEPVRFQYAPGAAPRWVALASLLVGARWIRSAVLAPIPNALPPLPTVAQVRPAGISLAVLTETVPLVASRLAKVNQALDDVDDPTIASDSSSSSRMWRG